MGQALYRKYRPKSLGEAIGQEHITDTLEQAIKNGRISHAYLFTGPRGVGKTSVARILAHQINKLPYGDDTHLDIIEIDAASNRRIDDIRDLRDKVHIAPTSAAYKVYIIDEVHMLTGESFNALLKTLEEPPAHVVFILATTEVHKLPATIVSRAQRYSFRPVELQKIMAHLKDIAEKEGFTIDDDALQLIAQHGDGSFRDSISLLDQLANVSGGNITGKVVEANLGLAPKTAIEALVQALTQKDHQKLISQLESLEQQGTTTASLVPQLIRALQNAAQKHPQLYRVMDQLIEVPRAYNPSIKLLTTLVTHTLKDETKQTSKHVSVSIQASKPVLEVTKAPRLKPQIAITPPEPTKTPDSEPANSEPIAELTDEQWVQVLTCVKNESAPLQAIFRQASPNFDQTAQKLTLTFKYPLHSKRATDGKAKNIFANALKQVLGSAPIIEAVVDSTVKAPAFVLPEKSAPQLDQAAKTVADLMGGGEAVTPAQAVL